MEKNNEKVRFRTINGTIMEIKKEDPETCITYGFIRKLCDENKIQYIKHGSRYIINYDEFIRLISKGED